MDYDVSAEALSSPPSTASLTTYRPAITVRNNGRFAAIATGTVSAYLAGLRVFHSDVFSGSIAPGSTGLALADTYWTPDTKGDYTWIGYVSTNKDQVEPNNNMAATKVTVGDTPPPPAPEVQAHAAQHEEGGQDEVIVDGLHGTLADPQLALAHKASHQMGGTDQLDVTGLPGILSTPQPLADHHSSHEDGGGDELNVDNLHGELYNLQKPQVHANEAHDPNFSAKPHGNADHDPNFCPLDEADLVAPHYLGTGSLATGNFLCSTQVWRKPNTSQVIASLVDTQVECPRNRTTTVLTGSFAAGLLLSKSLTRVYIALGQYNPLAPASRITIDMQVQQPSDPVWRGISYILTPPVLTSPGAPMKVYARLDFRLQPSPFEDMLRSISMELSTLFPSGETTATPVVCGSNGYSRDIYPPEKLDFRVRVSVPDIADMQAIVYNAAVILDQPSV